MSAKELENIEVYKEKLNALKAADSILDTIYGTLPNIAVDDYATLKNYFYHQIQIYEQLLKDKKE